MEGARFRVPSILIKTALVHNFCGYIHCIGSLSKSPNATYPVKELFEKMVTIFDGDNRPVLIFGARFELSGDS